MGVDILPLLQHATPPEGISDERPRTSIQDRAAELAAPFDFSSRHQLSGSPVLRDNLSSPGAVTALQAPRRPAPAAERSSGYGTCTPWERSHRTRSEEPAMLDTRMAVHAHLEALLREG